MNDETIVDPSHISVNSTYQTYEDNDVNQVRPKNKGEGTSYLCFPLISLHNGLIFFMICCINIQI